MYQKRQQPGVPIFNLIGNLGFLVCYEKLDCPPGTVDVSHYVWKSLIVNWERYGISLSIFWSFFIYKSKLYFLYYPGRVRSLMTFHLSMSLVSLPFTHFSQKHVVYLFWLENVSYIFLKKTSYFPYIGKKEPKWGFRYFYNFFCHCIIKVLRYANFLRKPSFLRNF